MNTKNGILIIYVLEIFMRYDPKRDQGSHWGPAVNVEVAKYFCGQSK